MRRWIVNNLRQSLAVKTNNVARVVTVKGVMALTVVNAHRANVIHKSYSNTQWLGLLNLNL